MVREQDEYFEEPRSSIEIGRAEWCLEWNSGGQGWRIVAFGKGCGSSGGGR